MKRWLSSGAPYLVVLVVVAVAAIGLLVVASQQGDEELRGYAHIRVTESDCRLDLARSRNAVGCERLEPNVYRVTFARSLEGAAPVATLETCCKGQISASVESDRVVLIAMSPSRYPALAYIVVA